MLQQKNVQPHVEIDGGDILNFTSCNYLPHPSSQVEKMGGVFFVKFFVAIPSLIVVLKPLHHLPSSCERACGAFFWGSIIQAIFQSFVGDIVFFQGQLHFLQIRTLGFSNTLILCFCSFIFMCNIFIVQCITLIQNVNSHIRIFILSLQKFLVFQIKNFGQKNHIWGWGPKGPLVILDKLILTCPM